MSLLCAQSLTKIFSYRSFPYIRRVPSFTAVDNISFELQEGEILGILGHNGAGKTTTISMLLGILTPTSGSIAYFGKDLCHYKSQVLTHVTSASAYTKLPPALTVWENLDIVARLYMVPTHERKQRIEYLLEFFGMAYLRDQPVGPFSAGQMTRLMLAKAFLPQPRIVLLDEPTASLDPDIARDVRHFVLQQKKQHGVSFIFTSHNMDEVTHVCDRVLVFKQGKIVANNTPRQLAATITKAKVELLVPDDMARAGGYLRQMNIVHTIDESWLSIEIDEHAIAALLIDLARAQIHYTQITIQKPTLEDYFLQLAHR